MNYIYDILLNFSDVLYDFYDWNTNDNIINIRKIPVFKVDSKTLKDFKENVIELNKDFLNQIEQKTEVFTSKDIKHLEYASLFSDGIEVVALFVKNHRIQKSKMLLDEELEVLEVMTRLKEQTIAYRIIKRDKNLGFKTRKELEMERMIHRGLSQLEKDHSIEKLQYIYYECFNEKECNKEKMISHFYEQLEKEFDKYAKPLYQFLKLIQVQK